MVSAVYADDAREVRVPVCEGFAVPARFDEHAQTLMTWPPEEESIGTDLAGFRDEVETVARAIARFEPVTMLVDPDDETEVRRRCGDAVALVVVPVDACWLRDNGPIFIRDQDRRVAGVHFGFNGWGGRFDCSKTQAMPSQVVQHLNMRCYRTPFICEGGGISVDGAGTLVTTEQVMLNSNRYPGLVRDDVERSLNDYLGIERVIWLELGLVEDTETDGHVDNVVEFVAPGVALVQTVRDRSNPNYALLQDNLRRLSNARDARGYKIEIIEMDVLPYQTAPDGKSLAIPYTNAYVLNGAVVAPQVDPQLDDHGYRILEKAYPGRTIVPVPGFWQAVGGGGIGCITQQVPAGQPALEPNGVDLR